MGIGVVFGSLSFRGCFFTAGFLLFALRDEFTESEVFEVARGAKAEEFRKRCMTKGKFWHKNRDVPRKLLSFGKLFWIGKVTKKKPLVTGSRDLEPFPAQPSFVGYLGFCARIGSSECIFYEAITGCAERCGKGGMKTLEGVVFRSGTVCVSLATASPRPLELGSSRSLSCACRRTRCRTRAVIRAATRWLAILESAR